jgi:hypothetical protein
LRDERDEGMKGDILEILPSYHCEIFKKKNINRAYKLRRHLPSLFLIKQKVAWKDNRFNKNCVIEFQ